MKNDTVDRTTRRARLVAASMGVTASVVAVLLMRVQGWVMSNHVVDCPGAPGNVCSHWGHPYMHLGLLILAVGLLSAYLFWLAYGGDPSR